MHAHAHTHYFDIYSYYVVSEQPGYSYHKTHKVISITTINGLCVWCTPRASTQVAFLHMLTQRDCGCMDTTWIPRGYHMLITCTLAIGKVTKPQHVISDNKLNSKPNVSTNLYQLFP